MARLWWLSVVVVLLGGCVVDRAGVETRPVREDLGRILSGKSAILTDRRTERDILDLLRTHGSRADSAAIFVALAHWSARPKGGDAAKVRKYAALALRYPLSAVQTCETCIDLGAASEDGRDLRARWGNQSARRGLSDGYLKAWQVLGDSLRIHDWTPTPGVGGYDINRDDPRYAEVVKSHQAEVARRQASDDQNRLWELRLVLAQKTLEVYGSPEAPAFEQDLQDVLGDRERARKIVALCVEALR